MSSYDCMERRQALKTIKCMNILNGIYVFVCLISMLGSSMNLLQYKAAEHNLMLANICEALFPVGPFGVILATLIPFGPVAWIVGIVHYILNCKKADYQASIGKKWIWLIVWPFLDVCLWMGAVCALVGFTGGV